MLPWRHASIGDTWDTGTAQGWPGLAITSDESQLSVICSVMYMYCTNDGDINAVAER